MPYNNSDLKFYGKQEDVYKNAKKQMIPRKVSLRQQREYKNGTVEVAIF